MKKTLLVFVLLLFVGLQASMAQTRVVKGRVVDEKGEGVPGASIKIKGTQTGTIADIDGNYELEVPEGSAVLVITGLGMGQKETTVSATDQSIVTEMSQGTREIGEVKIYGKVVDPQTYTGSVVGVTAEEIAKRPVTNVIKALEGIPGIQMTSGGGQPGADPEILMRGMGSLSASSAPLIVLDGAIYSGTLSSLNPNDIESSTLLKDATAGSLYGSRGANGVIMITTKKGKKSEKPRINVDASVGIVNRMMPFYETMGAKEYYETSFRSYQNLFGNSNQEEWMYTILGNYNAYNVPSAELIGPDGKLNPNASLKYDDNWLEAISRTGVRQQYSFDISNGDDRSNYYFSLGYNNDPGIVEQSSYDRITTLLNVNAKVTDWLSTGLKLSTTYDNQRAFVTTNTAYVNPFFSAQVMAPIFPIYLRDSLGTVQYDENGEPIYDFGENPQYGQSRAFGKNTNVVASLYQDDRTSRTLMGTGLFYLEANFLKDFTLRSDFSLDYLNLNNKTFNNMLYGDAASVNGAIDRTLQTRLTYTFRQLATWSPSFGIFADDHNLMLMASHENYLLRSDVASVSRSGFTGTAFSEGAAAAVNAGSTSYTDFHAIESYIGSLSYNYKRKYNFEANIRRDGTSRFAAQSRWGNFWSVGAGWVISEEDFMSDLDWINELKIRMSYGVQGNENLGSGGYYAWMPTYHFFPNYINPGYRFNTWGNPGLKWENNSIINPGIDFTVLKGRLSGSFDFYSRGSNDLLYVRPYAPSTGIGGIRDNVGAMKNEGLELVLKGRIVDHSKFKWDVAVTLQRVKNTITDVQGADTLYGSGTIMTKGLPYNAFFMPEFAGVQAETDGAGLFGGDELWYIDYDFNADGELVRVPEGTVTNDYQIANLISNRKYVGSGNRDVEGSFGTTVTYGNFELFVLTTFGIGGKFYDNTYANLMRPDNDFQGNAWHVDMERAWTPENTNTDVPRADLTSPNIGNLSSRFLISNSFFKIQSANLSYTFPAKLMGGTVFQSAKIYVAGENLFYWAKRKGLDLNQSLFGTSSFNYFPYRTIMFGVRLGL